MLFNKGNAWQVKPVIKLAFRHTIIQMNWVTVYCVFHIRPMLQTRKWGAGLGSHQSPVSSYQGDYVCSDISHELIHHKIIPVPFRQPSTVFQPTGAAGEADHVEPSSLTCNRPTLASTRRGFRTRSFQMAFSCGDGYAHRWACHLMMMMICLFKTRMSWLPDGEKSLMICLAVSIEYRRVTNRRTDRQTDGHLATA